MTTRLDQIDGLVSLPPSNAMFAAASILPNINKRNIDTMNGATGNNNHHHHHHHGLRRTPVKTTPFVQAVSTRPPRWNDVEVSLYILLTCCCAA